MKGTPRERTSTPKVFKTGSSERKPRQGKKQDSPSKSIGRGEGPKKKGKKRKFFENAPKAKRKPKKR
jgi:ribonuclease R